MALNVRRRMNMFYRARKVPVEEKVEEEDEEDAEAALADSDEIDVNRPLPSMDELERIASHFSPTILQFGVQTRVWQVSPLIWIALPHSESWT